MGKHWAIVFHDPALADIPEFVQGDRPDDPKSAKEAERAWRLTRRLLYIPVTVRRTTADEDQRLSKVEAP